jgi:hypothetical protein
MTMAKAAQVKPMRKWRVYLKATYSAGDTVEVEAATKAEAKQKALESHDVDFDTRNLNDPDDVVVTDIEEEEF